MQQVQSSIEHANAAALHALKAKEEKDMCEGDMAYVESSLALAHAINGLTLAILSRASLPPEFDGAGQSDCCAEEKKA